MADKRITDLPQLAVAGVGDLIPIVDSSANITKRVPASGIVPDGTITSSKLANGSVAGAKLSDSGWVDVPLNHAAYSGKLQVRNLGGTVHLRSVDLTRNASGPSGQHNIAILDTQYRPSQAEAGSIRVAAQYGWIFYVTDTGIVRIDAASAGAATFMNVSANWLLG